MSEWRPIAEYDAFTSAQRPKRAVFYFCALPHPRRPELGLPPTVEMARRFGVRTCTHFLVLPADPPPPQE